MLGLVLATNPTRAAENRQPINTIADLIAAVRKCWKPPPAEQAHAGMQITVRFSITRDGRLQGKAAIRYESPDASEDERMAYRLAVADSLAHCAPFPVTEGLGNAIAGKPITIRFIDTRKQREATDCLWRRQAAVEPWVESLADMVHFWKPMGWAEEAVQITSGVGP
jgi:hypothetical protein